MRACVATLASTLLLGCLEGGTQPPFPANQIFQINLNVRNLGTGSGWIEVTYSSGSPLTVLGPCVSMSEFSAPVGPGEDCNSAARSGEPIANVSIAAIPAAGSNFVSWGGACSGNDPLCEIDIPSEAAMVELAVQVVIN